MVNLVLVKRMIKDDAILIQKIKNTKIQTLKKSKT